MPKASILIVEDEAIVAEDLSQKLVRLGYEVRGVTALGEEAVVLARDRHPDLVLMDIRLKGRMDGVEAAELIRRESDLPVIFLTAHSDQATLQRAKLAEPFGYLLKPFEERELETQLQIALYKHQTDQEVRQQREWLRVTLQSIGDAVITTDAAGQVTSLNPVAEELTGWKVAGALNRPIEEVFNIINEETRTLALNPVERVLREGHVVGLANHTAVISRDGKERAIEDSAAPIRDARGQTIGVVMVFHDVTAKRQKEEARRRSEALLTQAVRVAGLGIFEHDHRSDRIEFSASMREMAGFGEGEEVTIAAILQRVMPEDREVLAAAIRRAHDPAGDGAFEVEYRLARPDGRPRWVSARSQTFFEGEGSERRPVRTIGATVEVTERKEFQARLERLVAERTAKLQELVGELEHFSYTITHDMRAPLRGMHGFASLMMEACAQCQEREPKEFLRRIGTSAERMDSLITDALNYSRTVRHELPLMPVDAGALLRGMLDSYPELQPSKARIEIQGEIPLVMGNEAGLTQCFSNLLGNAVKFVKPDQTPEIRIWAEEVQSQRIEEAAVRHATCNTKNESPPSALNPQPPTLNPSVRICFEDKGIGIPKQQLPRVFDMFSRGHQSYAGTGIGLALVRKVIDRMGGKVGVESEEGKGSRFWLELAPAGPRRADD